jgi:hypothetical protein
VRRFLLILLLFVPPSLSVCAQDQPQPEPLAHIGPAVRAPVPIVAPEAEMPQEAHLKRQTGICLIAMVVDAQVMPQNPRVIRCTDPVFVLNSMDAVQKYRFKPAIRIADGQPVPVMITIEINFSHENGPVAKEPPTKVNYAFLSPPGTTSVGPDANGIYPLSKQLEAPQMTDFVSKGFGTAAMAFPDGVGCQVLLTLNKKGKPADAQVLDCDKAPLYQPAAESLLKSKYTPAKLNGKEVPVRMIVHLMYEGFVAKKKVDAGSPAAPSKP